MAFFNAEMLPLYTYTVPCSLYTDLIVNKKTHMSPFKFYAKRLDVYTADGSVMTD